MIKKIVALLLGTALLASQGPAGGYGYSQMPENPDPNCTYVFTDGQWIAIPFEEANSPDFDINKYIQPYMPPSASYIAGDEEIVAVLEVSTPYTGYEKLNLTSDLLVRDFEIQNDMLNMTNNFYTYQSMQTYMNLYEYSCADLVNFTPNAYAYAIVPWVKDLVGAVAYPESVQEINIRLNMINPSAINSKFLSVDPNPEQGIILAVVDLIKNLSGQGNTNYVDAFGNCQMLVTINDTPIALKFETIVTVENGAVSAYTPDVEIQEDNFDLPLKPSKEKGIASLSVLSATKNDAGDIELNCKVKYTNCPKIGRGDELSIIVPSDSSDDKDLSLYGGNATDLRNQVSYMYTYFDGAPNPKRTEYVIEIAKHQCKKYEGKYFVISNDIAKPPVDITNIVEGGE